MGVFQPTSLASAERIAPINAAASSGCGEVIRLPSTTTGAIIQVAERLAGDEYDLAIRDRWSLRPARHLSTLFDEDYVCIARRDHPRLSGEPTLDEFLDEGHVLISPRGRVPGVVDGPLKRLGLKRRVTVT